MHILYNSAGDLRSKIALHALQLFGRRRSLTELGPLPSAAALARPQAAAFGSGLRPICNKELVRGKQYTKTVALASAVDTLLILSCCIAFSAFLFSLIYLILTSRPVAPSESAIKCYFQFSRSYFESAYSNDIELYGKRLDTDSYSCGLGRQFLLVELTDWCKQIIYRLCVT